MVFRNGHNDSISIERGSIEKGAVVNILYKRSTCGKESGYVGARPDAHEADS